MGILRFAILWALAIAALVALLTLGRGQAMTVRSLTVIAYFGLGSFAGGALALLAARLAARLRPEPTARFAAMLLFLTLATAGATALIFYIDFRAYYAQWHDSGLTLGHMIEILFTGASSAYIYTVQSARPLLPFVLPLALAAALLFAKRRI